MSTTPTRVIHIPSTRFHPAGAYTLVSTTYTEGGLALRLVKDHEPYATITTCLPDVELGEGEFHVKTWSENEGLVEALLESGVLQTTGECSRAGYAQALRCRLTPTYSDLYPTA